MDSHGTAPPQTIGRFRIDAVLGSGGMGSVYKAFDPTLKRTVAVKTVRPDIERPEFLQRLTREAQACARLRHPNVVTVYEAGEIDGLVYIVMEYLQGADLGFALRRGELTFETKIRILMQVLDALEHTHREGVIHRDIKPSNVHVQPDGVVKVVDFGLARVAEISALTHTGDVMGTPDYASPEQLRGERVDRRSDIYSTGALAYEMFVGRRPFRTDSDTDSIGALVLRVLSNPAPPMDNMWARRFPEIERIVSRAMSKDPADRYQTAEDMRNALAAFLASSRQAITEAQAELAARDRRTVIEAQTMIAKGMPAEAQTMLADELESNPEAPGVRKMLDETRQAATLVSTATAPSASAASTSPAAAPTTAAPASQMTTVPVTVARSRMRWVLGAVAAAAIVIVGLMMRSSGPAPTSPSQMAATPPAAPPVPAPVSAPVANPSAIASEPAGAAPAALKPTSAPLLPAAAAAGTDTPAAMSPPIAPAREASAKELFAAKPDANGGGVNTGLRFRLIRRGDSGQGVDVEPSTTFHSGDRIRFAFDSNVDGYLYVVQQGSSGRWTVLFPGVRINGGKNAVKHSEEYQVPTDDWFKFDANPGTEQVFVFLSREPMDQLPGFDRPVTRTETVASAVVEDLQHRIRSRDLVFEKESENGEGDNQTQATYVVNRAEVGQAVAASITLNHQ